VHATAARRESPGDASIVVEIAYSTAMPDNDALRDDAFKRIVAEAIADGIRARASAADDGRR
jgi:N-acetylmuramoyl-L-alanine amidase